jgi:hypothetical protein
MDEITREPTVIRAEDVSAVGQRRRRWTDVITSTRGGEAF